MQTYTFHVSLPGFGRLWRKIEIPAEETLETLHLAIQDAYQFDNDHLYSFFMSGKAWDSDSEYTLYQDDDGFFPFFGFDMLEEDEDEDEDEENTADAVNTAQEPHAPSKTTDAAQGMALPDFDDEPAERPSPEQLREMFAQLKEDPKAREAFMQGFTEQMGLPPLMAQMILGNLDNFISNASNDDLNQILNLDVNSLFGDDGDEEDDDEEDEGEGDVRDTTLASLELKKGQKFLYLFDYGDEWRFNVRVHAVNQNGDPEAEYPKLVESVGEAPQQYPDDEDDEWDEEDEEDEEE